MKQPHDLFMLIKSLSPTEKRYVKLFASIKSTHHKPEYLKLFDALDSLEYYNEELLKKKLKNTAILNQLPYYKNYLQATIIKSMAVYYTESSTYMQLIDIIKSIDFLFSKSQYSLCRKWIEKGLKLAEQELLYGFVIELLQWEQKITFFNKGGINKTIHNIELQHNLTNINFQTINYKLAYTKLLSFAYSKGSFACENEKQFAENVLTKHALNTNPLTQNFEAIYYYNMALGLYYAIMSKHKLRVEYLLNALAAIENKKGFIKHNPMLYITVLHNLAVAYQPVGKYSLGVDTIKKAEDYIQKHKTEIDDITLITAHIKITDALFYLNMVNGNIQAVLNLEKNIKELLNANVNESYISNLLDLTYGMAWAFFINGNYEKTLDYLNVIITKYEEGYRDDLFKACRLLTLLAHYELNNFYFVESSLFSLKKYLQNRRKLSAAEIALIDFLKKSCKAQHKNISNTKKYFLELKETLDSDKTYSVSKMSAYIDLTSWADSKLESTPLIQLFTARYRAEAIKENG